MTGEKKGRLVTAPDLKQLDRIFQYFYFELGEIFGYLNFFWAGLHAVENGMAAPDPVFIVDDIDPFVGAVITGIKGETVGFQ